MVESTQKKSQKKKDRKERVILTWMTRTKKIAARVRSTGIAGSRDGQITEEGWWMILELTNK